jgi:NOL1/NOP2/sun family putative RNA methylase
MKGKELHHTEFGYGGYLDDGEPLTMKKIFMGGRRGKFMIPPLFLERLSDLGLDISIYNNLSEKSLYILQKKDEIVKQFQLKALPWCDSCFWGNDIKKIEKSYYHAVFMQDPISVVPVIALKVKNSETVLDLCAAPGSKTLHLARLAGQVIASDSHRYRIQRLYRNLDRFGIGNCRVIRCDGRKLRLEEPVDKVLVDAPCSGEGMVRKLHKTMKMWSLKRISRLARLQKQLVLHGLKLLKREGVLVYSTCTFAPEENEGVIQSILEKGNATVESILVDGLRYSPGLRSWRGKKFYDEIEKTIRIYPFHNNTNGFFLAKLRKLNI